MGLDQRSHAPTREGRFQGRAWPYAGHGWVRSPRRRHPVTRLPQGVTDARGDTIARGFAGRNSGDDPAKLRATSTSPSPHLVEDTRGDLRLVVRQKTRVVAGEGLGLVLDSEASLLIGPRALDDVSGQDIADIVRTMGQEALDRSSAGERIIDPVALDHLAPSDVEIRGAVASGSGLGRAGEFHKEGFRVLKVAQQDRAMYGEISSDLPVEASVIGKPQAIGAVGEIG